ncbi:MAG: flagellar biosynthesis protein FlhF [Lachnospiraceae bacterium]|nr:flagellar biosynthesis protein FlhF [Lachnospiraceae bacterium]MBP5600634.1 flagellar biosynthesis protein FlhF [Lachnospiraceae bacterium]
MIIKKFQAKTENEAVELAKKELGNNVVVMNVRSVKRKGLFSFLKPQLVEITVALEEESEKREIHAAAPDARSITEALGKIAPIVEKAEAKKREETMSKKEDSDADKVIAERLNNLENLIEEKLQKPEEEKAKEKEVQEEEKQENDELKCFFELLHKTMTDNEVNEEYASSIIEETAKITKPGTPFDVALAGIYQKMILKFGKASTITPAEEGPKTVFFVGPTGVGKTTTIAKIASKFSVEQKKKVALLTADTYRIAAAEQLRTYANILEVPFRIIYTIEEMESALKDFTNFDYVFVDTAGHSHQNEEQKNVMGSFIHSVDSLTQKEVYLVVSATTKYRDLRSIADAYSQITDYKLIFTKLDETTALGNLLNLKLYTGADLSYVTCGQNVPDDIEDFNAQRTVKNLLGGRK